jgi:uncharacterized protein (TIGR02246 family)
MQEDEQKISDLIARWLRATAAGDLPQILSLMAEDVVFLLPGHPPMRGKETFAAGFQTALQHFRIDSSSQIQEIHIAGDLAYCWNHLTVTMTPRQAGAAKHRAGYTLTILRKQPDGNWVVARDANMLTEVPSTFG